MAKSWSMFAQALLKLCRWPIGEIDVTGGKTASRPTVATPFVETLSPVMMSLCSLPDLHYLIG